MVTKSSDTIFDEISQQIVDTFNELIKQLTDRRDQLLTEVNERRVEFEQKLNSQQENLRELEKIQMQIEKMKANQANLVRDPIQKQITNLTQAPNLKFECQFKELSESIRLLGAVTPTELPVEVDYSKKLKTMSANHIFEVNAPSYLHIDGTDLYIIDHQNSIIQVFDATDWSYKNLIQIEGVIPICIASNSHHLYITYQDRKSQMDRINQLTKANFQLIKTSILFKSSSDCNSQLSLALTDEEIFAVGSNSKNKIFMYDKHLHYRREFGKLDGPRCIRINQEQLYALDAKYNLHMFNTSGQHLGVSYEFRTLNIWGYLGRLHHVESFCFDQMGNAIFVSPEEGRVSVITQDGKKVYEIGKDCQCTEDIGKCSSAAVFRDKIIVACINWNSVKIF